MDSVLEYTGVTKKYESKIALKDVTLSVPSGAIVGLLGPNGSGKTTLLKLASGLLHPTSGEVKVCGLPVSAESKSLVAYQPDCVYLNDWMNVSQLVKMMQDFYSNFNREKALDMLSRLKIGLKDKLKAMSKGTKEKVQLILTMSREVPLYILDEPIGGVDPAARDYILNTILTNTPPSIFHGFDFNALNQRHRKHFERNHFLERRRNYPTGQCRKNTRCHRKINR